MAESLDSYMHRQYGRKKDVMDLVNKKKVSKEVVNYRTNTKSELNKQCMECEYYLKVGDDSSPCAKVIGMVEAEGLCDLFERRAEPLTESLGQPSINITISR